MPRKKKIKQSEIAPQEKPIYSLVLKLNGQEFQASADTLLEAMQLLRPEKFNTKGVLRITKRREHCDGATERILNIPQMKRLFTGDVKNFTRQVALQSTAKYIENVLA